MSVQTYKCRKGEIAQKLAKIKQIPFEIWDRVVSKTDEWFEGGNVSEFKTESQTQSEITCPTGTQVEMKKAGGKVYESYVQNFWVNSRREGKWALTGLKLLGAMCRAKTIKVGHANCMQIAHKIITSDDNQWVYKYKMPMQGAFKNDVIRQIMFTQGISNMSNMGAQNQIAKQWDTDMQRKVDNLYKKYDCLMNVMQSKMRRENYRRTLSKLLEPSETAKEIERTQKWLKGRLYDSEGKGNSRRSMWRIHKDYGFYWFYDDDDMYLFTTDDYKRLMGYVKAFAAMYSYAAGHMLIAMNDRDENVLVWKKHFRQSVDMILDVLKNADIQDADQQCMQFSKCQSAYLAKVAGQHSSMGQHTLLKEATIKGWVHFRWWKRYMDWLNSMPVDLALDIGKVFKVFQVPTQDLGASFCDKIHKQQEKKPAAMTHWDTFKCMMKKQLCQAIMNKTKNMEDVAKANDKVLTQKVAPDWAWDLRENRPPNRLKDYKDISMTGTIRWRDREENATTWFKDSGVVSDKQDSQNTDPTKRNMVLQYMYHDEFPTPVQAWGEVRSSNQMPWSLQTVKPEAKKAGKYGRGVSVSNLSSRLAMSDLEWNIDELSKYIAGSTMGMSTQQVELRVTKALNKDLYEGFKCVQINFDLDGFSPNMDVEFQKRVYDFWADVQDKPEIKLLMKNFENAPFYMEENGYRLKGQNPGRDIEGWKGKQMTFVHTCLMAMCVHLLRERYKKWVDIVINLSAFIDDGTACVTLKEEVVSSFLDDFKPIMHEVQNDLGFQISDPKTYQSDRFTIFLNIVWVDGRRMQDGMKVLMKYNVEEEEQWTSLDDKIESRRAAMQGAVENGVGKPLAQVNFLYMTMREIQKYGCTSNLGQNELFWWIITPKSHLGLGIPPLSTAFSSQNTDPESENWAWIDVICSQNKKLDYVIKNLANMPLKVKTPVQTLMNPTSVPVAAGVRSANVVSAALQKRIMSQKYKMSYRVIELIDEYEAFDIEGYAAAVVSGCVAERWLIDAYNSTPYGRLSSMISKMVTGNTIGYMLGARGKRYVNRTHKRAVHTSAKLFSDAIYGDYQHMIELAEQKGPDKQVEVNFAKNSVD